MAPRRASCERGYAAGIGRPSAERGRGSVAGTCHRWNADRCAAGAGWRGVNHPDAQRRFRVMTNVEELERALEYPMGQVDDLSASRAKKSGGARLQRSGACGGIGRDGEDHCCAALGGVSGAGQSGREGIADNVLRCAGKCAAGEVAATDQQRAAAGRAPGSSVHECDRAAAVWRERGARRLQRAMLFGKLLARLAVSWKGTGSHSSSVDGMGTSG